MMYINCLLLLLTVGGSVAFSPIVINAGETGRHDLEPACQSGILYGCTNISTAHDCNVVKTCISSVWSKMKLPEDNDDICQICKEMVKEARDQLLSNETQEEIKEVFDGSCNLIPIKIIAEECCKVADQFIPELVETLASEMNPQMVCATAGLCNSERIDKMLKERQEKKPTSDCDICMDHAKDLQRYIKNTPKSILLEKALVACGHLNSFSTGCRIKVIDNFHAIINYLEKNLKNVNEDCAFFGFCQQNEPTYTLGKSEEDPTCEFCEKMVQHWIEALTSGTTEDEFKQVLEAICDRLGNFKDECHILVEDYFIDLYNLLVNQVKPKEVCQIFGLCEKKNLHYRENVWALVPPGAEEKIKAILADEAVGKDEGASVAAKKDRLPAVKLQKSEFAELTPAEKPKLARVPLVKSNKINALPLLNAENAALPLERFSLNYDATKTTCVMCEYVLHEIQNMLTEESNEEKIKEALDKICSIMPKSVEEECEEFVNQYADLVIALLVQEIDPSQVCTYLKLCPGKVTKQLTKTPDAECELCEFVIHLLDEYLEDDATEETIRDTLDEVCGYMPKSIVKQCQEFVNEYEPMIVEALAAALTPDETCVELNMCKPKSLSEDTVKHESPSMTEWKKEQVEAVKDGLVVESPGCVICEFAMTQIASMLDDNSTDEEIIQAVENVCDYLPKTVKSDCKAFVDTYGHDIIDVLKDETKNPEEACSLIGLCSTAKKQKKSETVPLKLNRCEGCEMVVSYLDRMLKDEETEEHIEEALDKVCNIVPPGYAKQCKKIVHVYGAYLVGLIQELDNEHEVCAAVNLCLQEKQLLGGDKCTWGPSYWCISPFHAKSCKATSHCKEKVWKKQ